MTTAIVVLLLSLMGAGTGFAVGVLLQPGKDSGKETAKPSGATPAAETEKQADAEGTAEGEPEAAAEAEGAGDAGAEEETEDADVKIIPIPPVLTTLADPPGTWIRLEASILVKPGGQKTPELLAEQAGEQVLAYLRTVRLSQLEGPSGLLALRDDLNETVRSLSQGDVRAILIHGLLVE
ncbi:flagellar basal body-associated FliL family protein [Aestuariivirga sp.]|uniref:flagellar basal body-associated FliL family protein n=1 Tax=Aestuariivirga sp. TaxID=2650926 RepID=UPI0025BED613|nr:flagellar basal body-associated FliL family protein [Aestuariivirga sp.]MCA3554241.1 flagellar basal body-associated FliL family protein [Aestuariivirga sp.]